MKKSEINFTISLDENKHPQTIHWTAEDSGMEGEKETKALLISLWDKKDNATMRIDLWTKEMMVEEMNVLYYETLLSMADTFLRATNNQELSDKIRLFAKQFGTETGVVGK